MNRSSRHVAARLYSLGAQIYTSLSCGHRASLLRAFFILSLKQLPKLEQFGERRIRIDRRSLLLLRVSLRTRTITIVPRLAMLFVARRNCPSIAAGAAVSGRPARARGRIEWFRWPPIEPSFGLGNLT
jgi:hypothetical protein